MVSSATSSIRVGVISRAIERPLARALRAQGIELAELGFGALAPMASGRLDDVDLLFALSLREAAAARFLRRPYVVSVSALPAGRARALAILVVRDASAVLCRSQAVAAELRELGVRQLHLVSPGIDVHGVMPCATEPRTAVYVGPAPSTADARAVAEVARALPLTVSPGGEAWRWISEASVVVVPRGERGERSALQAMAWERAVVVFGAGPGDVLLDRLAVRHGDSGLVVNAGDASGLKAAVKLLLEDAELRERLASAGRWHAIAHASWEAVAYGMADALEYAMYAVRGHRGATRRPVVRSVL